MVAADLCIGRKARYGRIRRSEGRFTTESAVWNFGPRRGSVSRGHCGCIRDDSGSSRVADLAARRGLADLYRQRDVQKRGPPSVTPAALLNWDALRPHPLERALDGAEAAGTLRGARRLSLCAAWKRSLPSLLPIAKKGGMKGRDILGGK